MPPSILPRRFMRSCKFPTTRTTTSHNTLPIHQISKPRGAPQPKSFPTRRFSSTSSSQTSTAPDPKQPISSHRTHYELFPQSIPQGPPPSGPFEIDPRTLRNEFLKLQATAHPDRHPSSQKLRADATSALINEAYKTLLFPLLRAQYLLALRGIDVASDETAKMDDPELLMEVLEANEKLEEAQEEGDLVELRTRNEERIVDCERVLGEAFAEDDLERARSEAVKLRYWVNIKEGLQAWEKGKPVVLVH